MNTRCAMMLLAMLLLPNAALVALGQQAADAPGNEATDEEPLSKEAQAIVAELRGSLPADSEAMAMLDDILAGSQLGADDGWFRLAQARSLLDWTYVQAGYDSNQDNQVTIEEFGGSEQDFQRLDRDNNSLIEEADLRFNEHSLAPSAGLQMFFMGDRDANGKLTRQEFAALFDMLASQGSDYLSLDELRDQLALAAPRKSPPRADRTSRSTLIRALKDQEIGSLQSGPEVGEAAPDFTLQDIEGNEVRLASMIGDKPVVLIFGNFTCGPFRSQAGNIEQLASRYQGRAHFLLVYVREAHPTEGWWMLSNQRAGIELPQPTTFKERREIAMTCRDHLELKVPMLIDTLDDAVGSAYSGMPNRLYLIDGDGKVVFKNGRGPFGFHPRQLEQSLVLLLNR
jgi:thiol-disulfide isomerase/thioredoxin